MNLILRAVLNSSVTSLILQGTSLFLAVAIARLLTPKEVGIYAISSVLALVLAEFKTLGAGIYLVREEVISTQKVRAAVGVSLLISWFLGFFLIIASFYVAEFYNLPEAKLILFIFSLTFFLGPHISIPFALYTRDLNFGVQRNIQVISAIATLISTLAFIFFGFGVYAIALGYTFSVFVQFFLINFIYKHSEMVFLPSFKNIKPIFNFGVLTSGAGFLKKANTLLPDAIIGKLGTPVNVAIFSRGFGFSDFVFMTMRNGVGAISLSYLSKVKREGGDIASAYIEGSYLFNGIALPVLAVAALLSLPAIRLLFGDQWIDAAPIASLFMLWAAFRSINFHFNDLVIAVEKTKLLILREGIGLLFTLIICLYAFPYGLDFMAACFVFFSFIEMIALSFVTKKVSGVNLIKLLTLNMKNFIIASICISPLLILKGYIDIDLIKPIYVFFGAALFFPAWWYVCIIAFKHPLSNHILNIIKPLK